jgi:hypothetical protein
VSWRSLHHRISVKAQIHTHIPIAMSNSPAQAGSSAAGHPYTPPPDKDKSSTPTSTILGKRRRACEHCRSSKAKCIFEEETDSTCKNCAKSKRHCVIEHDRRYPTHPREGSERRPKKEKHDISETWTGISPEAQSVMTKGSPSDRLCSLSY